MGTTIRAPLHASDEVVDGIPVHRLGLATGQRLRTAVPAAGYYIATRWAASRLARQLEPALVERAQRADVVHCVRVGREPLALASEAAARRADRPFVFTPLHHPRWGSRRHRVYVDLYRRADRLIALTETERRGLERMGVAAERVAVTGVGPLVADRADPDAFRALHGIAGPLVLFLGQHFRYKGFLALLDAAPLVWRRRPDVVFAFAGPAVGRSDRAFRGRDARIRRLGAIDLQTKTDALAACDVLCVPSTQESFGAVLTEAWAMGRPVVAGDIPAVRDVVDDGVDGWLVVQDAREIADRLVWLLDHPTEAAAMGSAGERKVKERWSWPALAAETERIYASLS